MHFFARREHPAGAAIRGISHAFDELAGETFPFLFPVFTDHLANRLSHQVSHGLIPSGGVNTKTAQQRFRETQGHIFAGRILHGF